MNLTAVGVRVKPSVVVRCEHRAGGGTWVETAADMNDCLQGLDFGTIVAAPIVASIVGTRLLAMCTAYVDVRRGRSTLLPFPV